MLCSVDILGIPAPLWKKKGGEGIFGGESVVGGGLRVEEHGETAVRMPCMTENKYKWSVSCFKRFTSIFFLWVAHIIWPLYIQYSN